MHFLISLKSKESKSFFLGDDDPRKILLVLIEDLAIALLMAFY
ncbi:hypothetical protein Lepto7376_1292 [[Leptolyngbya] sp. PCC 7376]|nr:hypothetical protein Lepto7376_1292 [[Leptolyngbya] sp. PCC 7376]